MKFLPILILCLNLSSAGAAQDSITREECKALRGTYTELGCLMTDTPGSAKIDLSRAKPATPEQCKCMGGRWHQTYGCLAPIDVKECKAIGGQIDPELGCVKRPTAEQCKAAGGKYREDGSCELQPAPSGASSQRDKQFEGSREDARTQQSNPPCGGGSTPKK